MKKRYSVQSLDSFSDNPKAAPRTKIENLKWLGLSVIAFVLVVCGVAALAQQQKKLARMCYLGASNSPNSATVKPTRERLRELGYVEGQNFTIEYRGYQDKVERLPVLAAELLRLNCDVIVTAGTEAAQAAKDATKTVPIVMAFGDDAVRRGIVAELARPGGNITGMTNIGAEMYGKRLELLKETVPKLSRVAFFWSPSNPDADYNVKETEPVARFLQVGIQSISVEGPDDIERAFRAAGKGRANGLMLASGGFFAAHRKRIIELVEKYRLPAVYPTVTYVDAGALMVYGEDRIEQLRRAAEIVDKILKGTKPADIPVERPKKFDFVINLKAAKQIGFTVPPEVLARATKIIK